MRRPAVIASLTLALAHPAAVPVRAAMRTPPALPQVAALAELPDGDVAILSRLAAWRLDPRSGASSHAPHPPLTGDLAPLDGLGARPLPVFGLHADGDELHAFLEGGRVRTYRLGAGAPVLDGESERPQRAERLLRRRLADTGRSHLHAWPERRARFRVGRARCELTPRRLVIRRPGSPQRVVSLPGFTYAALMEHRPEDWGLRLDPEAGIGPFVLDGEILWLGWTFRREERLTGVGGLVRLKLPDGEPELLRPDALATRSARDMAIAGDELLVAVGHFREGRWWGPGEPPEASLWYGIAAGLVRHSLADGRWRLIEARADPAGVEAPVALLPLEDGLVRGLGSGLLVSRGGEDVLHGVAAGGGLGPLRRFDGDALAELVAPDGRGCDTALWLRRVTLRSSRLAGLLVDGLSSPDPGVRALAASACGWQRERACVPGLLSAFAAEGDRCAEAAMALALGRLGEEAAVAPLAARAEASLRRESAGAEPAHADGHGPPAADQSTDGHAEHDHAGHPHPSPESGAGASEVDLATARSHVASGHHHSACACRSLAGEGPGGAHSLVDALLHVGPPARAVFRRWLAATDPLLRALGSALVDTAAREDLSPETRTLLEEALGREPMAPEQALSALALEPATGGGFRAADVRAALAALDTLAAHPVPGTDRALRAITTHPLLGERALEILAEREGPGFLPGVLAASTDPLELARAVRFLARARRAADLEPLGQLAERLRRDGWRRDRAERVRRAIVHVARYYGTADGCRLWHEVALDLRAHDEVEEALADCAALGWQPGGAR